MRATVKASVGLVPNPLGNLVIRTGGAGGSVLFAGGEQEDPCYSHGESRRMRVTRRGKAGGSVLFARGEQEDPVIRTRNSRRIRVIRTRTSRIRNSEPTARPTLQFVGNYR